MTITLPATGFENYSDTLKATDAIAKHLADANLCDSGIADVIAPDILYNWGEYLEFKGPGYYELNQTNVLAMFHGKKNAGDFNDCF